MEQRWSRYIWLDNWQRSTDNINHPFSRCTEMRIRPSSSFNWNEDPGMSINLSLRRHNVHKQCNWLKWTSNEWKMLTLQLEKETTSVKFPLQTVIDRVCIATWNSCAHHVMVLNMQRQNNALWCVNKGNSLREVYILWWPISNPCGISYDALTTLNLRLMRIGEWRNRLTLQESNRG